MKRARFCPQNHERYSFRLISKRKRECEWMWISEWVNVSAWVSERATTTNHHCTKWKRIQINDHIYSTLYLRHTTEGELCVMRMTFIHQSANEIYRYIQNMMSNGTYMGGSVCAGCKGHSTLWWVSECFTALYGWILDTVQRGLPEPQCT